MKVTIYNDATCPERSTHFAEGVRACGDEPVVRQESNYSPSEIAVVFAWNKQKYGAPAPCCEIIRGQRKRNLPLVVSEIGFIGTRFTEWMVGLGDLNGMAYCGGEGKPLRRPGWKDLLQPWGGPKGRHKLLIIGQQPDDRWLQDITQAIFVTAMRAMRKSPGSIITKLVPVFRPHPSHTKAKLVIPYPNMPFEIEDSDVPLTTSLRKTYAVVTQNSNVAVDAVLAGVPAVTCSPYSMAWDVSIHDVRQIDHPWTGDRMPWLSELSWAQWSTEEIQAGECWRHMKTCLRC